MMDPWMDLYISVMISPMNEPSVAEYQIHSNIATWNIFYDGSIDGCVLFGHDNCYEWV